MKHPNSLWVLLFLFFLTNCKKNETVSYHPANSTSFFDSTVQYLKSNLSASDFAQLDLTTSKTLIYKNQNRGVQIFEKGNLNKFLLLQKKSSTYSGNWVDISNLIFRNLHYSHGIVVLNSLDKSCATKLYVDSNLVIKQETVYVNDVTVYVTNFKKNDYVKKKTNSSAPDVAVPIPPDIVETDDGYGISIDYFSWYWFLDQATSNTYVYFNGGSSGGSSQGGSGAGNNNNNVAVAPVYFPPDTPIPDLKQELKCFTANSTSTYAISININEPDPGTRDIVNPLSAFPVGHTFLTLEQHNADGTSIVRTIGFYPKHSVKPGSETDQSIFGDDSYTPYDVALDFTVSGAEMGKVVDRILGQQAYQYDLNNFNCTNAAMDALKSININLPSTQSNEPLFGGNDPGDLGEDIRGLNLNNFSAQNGNRKITRTISNSNNQYSKGRIGGC